MSPPQRYRPLNDAERDRMGAILSRFQSQYALNNAEKVDGFFAASICSPEIARPSQYLPEIWGGEMTDEEAFDNQEQFQEFLSLLTNAPLEQRWPHLRRGGNIYSVVIRG
jgi:uncharacterized protein